MIRRLGLAAGILCSLQLIQPATALQVAGGGDCDVAAAGAAARGEAVAGPTSSTIPASNRKRVELVLIDAANLSVEVTAALRDEVVAVFGQAGVDASFPPLAAPAGSSDTTVRLKIIVLGEDGTRFGVDGTRMGAKLMVPGEACDTAYVFLPVVLGALDSRPQPVESLSATRVGRALGRVVVHEAVHALAPGLAHARAGVMKATPNLRDLLASTTHLDEDSTAAVLSALQSGV